MVLGETEITGQIKTAYEIARTSGLTARVLNRVFQRAFQAAKAIRTRTGIGRGAVSIKSAALELVEKTLGDISRQSIMVIGAGEMAERCVRLLAAKGVGSILISNRSFDRALDLAMRCGGEAVCFGECLFGMRDVDVVIAATSSPESLLTHRDTENLMRARRQRRLLLIDLSVPRNIDPAVRSLDNVSLYNIDDLETIAQQGVEARQQELVACYQIIEAHVAVLIERPYAENEWRHQTWLPQPFFNRVRTPCTNDLARENYAHASFDSVVVSGEYGRECAKRCFSNAREQNDRSRSLALLCSAIQVTITQNESS